MGVMAIGLAAIRPVAILLCNLRETGDRYDPLLLVDPEDHDPGAAAPRDPDIVDRNADNRSGIGDQHDLVVVADREHRDDGVPAAAQIHIVDALPAPSGDAVIVSRAADAKPPLGDAQHELLARGDVEELLLGQRRLADTIAVFALALVRLRRLFRDLRLGGLALLAHLAAPIARHAEIAMAHIGSDLLVPQDRHRDDLVFFEEADAAHADGVAAREDAYIADRETDRLAGACR